MNLKCSPYFIYCVKSIDKNAFSSSANLNLSPSNCTIFSFGLLTASFLVKIFKSSNDYKFATAFFVDAKKILSVNSVSSITSIGVVLISIKLLDVSKYFKL